MTDFLNFCNHSFRNLVRPDEYDQVEESIWRQIDSQADGSNDYVTFHFARKDGTYREVLDHGGSWRAAIMADCSMCSLWNGKCSGSTTKTAHLP